MLEKSKCVSVYALTGSGKIRYIGLTSQTLSRRLNQHFQDMNRPHRKKVQQVLMRARIEVAESYVGDAADFRLSILRLSSMRLCCPLLSKPR